MTDEQIMKAAKEIVREFVRECDYTPEDDETAARVIRSVASSARREALEASEGAVRKLADAPSTGAETALGGPGFMDGYHTACNQAMYAIRDLKESVRALAGETGVEGEG